MNVVDEHFRTAQQRLLQPADAIELAAVGQAARRIDRLAVLDASASGRPRRSSPARSRPGPSADGSPRRPDSRDARAIRSRIESVLPAAACSPSAPARSAAAAAAARREYSPESTCRESPARCGSRTTSPSECCPAAAAAAHAVLAERDAPEAAAVDVRNAVVLGQPLVDERVVRRAAGRARCDPRA